MWITSPTSSSLMSSEGQQPPILLLARNIMCCGRGRLWGRWFALFSCTPRQVPQVAQVAQVSHNPQLTLAVPTHSWVDSGVGVRPPPPPPPSLLRSSRGTNVGFLGCEAIVLITSLHCTAECPPGSTEWREDTRPHGIKRQPNRRVTASSPRLWLSASLSSPSLYTLNTCKVKH